METNVGTKSEIFAWNDGRRIVDLQELAKQLHCKQCNSLLDLQRTERETRYGLASVLYIHCSCGFLNDVHTSKVQQNGEECRKSSAAMFEVNIKASINLLMYGDGSPSVLGFLALLDIPVPPPNDASLIVPVTNASHVPSVLPATVATITTSHAESASTSSNMASSSSRTAVASLPTLSTPLVSPAPERLAPVSSDSSTAAQVLNNDGESVRDGYHMEYDDHYHDVSDIDEEGGIDSDDDDGDEEYMPPGKQKSKLKSKSSPSSKKKAAPTQTKKARSKSAAKKTAPQGKAKTVKVNMKNVETQSGTKEAEEEVIDIKEEDDDEESENSEKDFDHVMEWSSAESNQDSGKESDDSQQEEEQLSKVEGTAKRKRGRPKGSTNKAKRERKSEAKTRKDSVPGETPGSADEDREIPSCTLCMKDFNSIRGYNVHMKRVHNQDMKEVEPVVYVCATCRQPFARHYSAVHHVTKRHWSPVLDPKEFVVAFPLKNIIETKHKEGCLKASYSCLSCHQNFTSQEKTCRHVCIDTQGQLSCFSQCPDGRHLSNIQCELLFSDRQGHLCDSCGEIFEQKSALDMHLLNVHNIASERSQRYSCPHCGAAFGKSFTLKKHMRCRHGAKPREKSFVCDICGKGYLDRGGLTRHVQRIHTQGKTYLCQFCPKAFFIRNLWQTHTRQHLGESPYHCAQCDQGLSSKYALMVHSRIHTGEKPYRCRHCRAAFSQKTSLDVHMKKHVKDGTFGTGGTVTPAPAAAVLGARTDTSSCCVVGGGVIVRNSSSQ